MSCSILLSMLVSLHLLLCGANGARMGGQVKFDIKISSTTFTTTHLMMEDNNVVTKEENKNIHNNDEDEVKKRELMEARVAACKDKEGDECGAEGKNGNLVTSNNMSTFTSTSIPKNEGNNNKGMELKMNSKGHKLSTTPPRVNHHKEKVDPHKYEEDMLDMTEMDYSPAKRKPPIHN